ncbi:TK/FER protein kinase [Loa loa]|uniref:Tyrosine-protein kinase n=1 Tax=Loa loa TaxID=7209 RepID=A0A1I7VNR2_LOALO|nr:TK/FER protein kinase [Loa loa]EFO24061.1 TK/FER protein kinase [Loa loa]
MSTSTVQMFEERMDTDLRNRRIFHGYISLADAKKLLTKEGDYLVRLMDYKGRFVCVLSTYHNGKVVTICINRMNKMYFFNDDCKDRSIGSLLDWHQNTKTPLTRKRIVLKNPIFFPSWNLMPSCILQLLGEICECYRMKTYEVVVRLEKGKFRAAAMLLTSKQLLVESKKQFMAEARILKELSHPNILQFYGVIVTALPFTMIVGLCQMKLLTFLQKKEAQKDQKIRYATEAAAALKYLTEKGYVHKDVRAKNCLIDRNMNLKLANFGYAASDQCPSFIHKEPLESISAGWLAPETMLRHDFSKETDVWAFGVLMWEIYKNGDVPFHGLSNMEIRSYVIHNQRRLELPKKAPIKVKQLMARCWEEEPSRRPTFQELQFILGSIRKDEI